jgi:hypothetical protein
MSDDTLWATPLLSTGTAPFRWLKRSVEEATFVRSSFVKMTRTGGAGEDGADTNLRSNSGILMENRVDWQRSDRP